MDTTQQWTQWLSQVPPEEQETLLRLLQKQGSHPVKITRTPSEDLLVTSAPPYLDVFHLHDVFNKLAFTSNILLKGPKGDGKTLSVITFAAARTIPLIIQECSEDTKKMDLMGSQTLIGDETIFTLGCIPAAIDTANECGYAILLLEELSALTPTTQKQLNAVTDFRKQCSMPFLGKTYKLREGAKLWVVGTMNPSVYGGTYDLNEDLKSRFEEIDLTYMENGQEKSVIKMACANLLGKPLPVPFENSTTLDDTIVSKVIKLAGETRQQATGYALSTRDVVRIIETIALLGVVPALQLVACKFEGDDKDTILKRIGSIFDAKLKLNKHWS